MCDKETRGNNIYYKEIKFKLSHNVKVVGSNPTPATKSQSIIKIIQNYLHIYLFVV